MSIGLRRVFTVDRHDHSTPQQGGTLTSSALADDSGIARLDTTATQTFIGSLIVPGIDLTDVVTLPDLNSTPMQSTIGVYVCTDGAVSVTDGRDWQRPDASGKYVVNKAAVAVNASTTDSSGDVMTAPDAGTYLLGVYAECTSAGSAGTLSVTISHTGASALTQTPVASLDLTAQGCESHMIAVLVVSGDVTYAATITGGTGDPAYSLRIVPIGRLA